MDVFKPYECEWVFPFSLSFSTKMIGKYINSTFEYWKTSQAFKLENWSTLLAEFLWVTLQTQSTRIAYLSARLTQVFFLIQTLVKSIFRFDLKYELLTKRKINWFHECLDNLIRSIFFWKHFQTILLFKNQMQWLKSEYDWQV